MSAFVHGVVKLFGHLEVTHIVVFQHLQDRRLSQPDTGISGKSRADSGSQTWIVRAT